MNVATEAIAVPPDVRAVERQIAEMLKTETDELVDVALPAMLRNVKVVRVAEADLSGIDHFAKVLITADRVGDAMVAFARFLWC